MCPSSKERTKTCCAEETVCNLVPSEIGSTISHAANSLWLVLFGLVTDNDFYLVPCVVFDHSYFETHFVECSAYRLAYGPIYRRLSNKDARSSSPNQRLFPNSINYKSCALKNTLQELCQLDG